MKYPLKQSLTALYTAASLAIYSGCRQPYQETPRVEGILTGHTVLVHNESQLPYITQEAVLHGKSYFITNKASDYLKLDEKMQRKVRTFGALPKEKAVKCIKYGVVTFDPETENDDYMFVLQGKGDTPVMDVKLKQKVQPSKDSQKTNDSECDVNDLTQDEMQFFIKTIKINEQEYYVPNVPDKDKSDAYALPFVLMPRSQTSLKISSDGTITLKGPVYRGISAPKVQKYAEALSSIHRKLNASQQNACQRSNLETFEEEVQKKFDELPEQDSEKERFLREAHKELNKITSQIPRETQTETISEEQKKNELEKLINETILTLN